MGIELRGRLHCFTDITLTGKNVLALKPSPGQRFVMIGPRGIGSDISKRWALSNNHPTGKFIITKNAFPLGMSVQIQNQILQDRADASFRIKHEAISPVWRVCSGASSRIPQCLLTFLLQLCKAPLKKLFEGAIADASEASSLRPGCRMQRFTYC